MVEREGSGIGKMLLGFALVLFGILLTVSGGGLLGLALSLGGIVTIIGTLLGRHSSIYSSGAFGFQ